MPARVSATISGPLLAAVVDYLAREQTRRPSKAALTTLSAAVEVAAPGAVASATRKLLEPRWLGDPPEWARALIRRHALGKVPELVWRRSRDKPQSSGRCSYGSRRIVVTASAARDAAGEIEQRVVVLHEITHALRPWHNHDEIFFDQFYLLLRAEGLYKAGLARGQARSLRAAARRARTRAPVTA
jgi:hypothetical protein